LALRSYVLSMTIPVMRSTYYMQTLFLMTFAGVVFRSELAVLVLTISIFIFFINQASLTGTIIPAGLAGLFFGLSTTVPIDSVLWQKWPLWPEWSGFYYNTILGNASNWGVSPWHYYFTNALPRLLLNPLSYTLLIPLAAYQPATSQRSFALLSPLLAFVALYSLLPHKEWRFILYIVPGLTTVSAMGASWIWQRRSKSPFYRLLNSVLIVSIIMSFAVSSGILAISRLNYPGSEAIMRLRAIESGDSGTIHVYADNLACQTGLTRFLEARSEEIDGKPQWIFDKTENGTALLEPEFWTKFDYVLTENLERTIGNWNIVSTIKAFDGVQLLKPGEAVGGPGLEQGEGDSSMYSLETGEKYRKILRWWIPVENFTRKTITRGWWIRLRMKPKLYVLKKTAAGTYTALGEDAVVQEAVVV
jgi:alpha-1,6-mannosyltransferase